MKSLYISFASFLIILVLWSSFEFYMKSQIDSYQEIINDQIVPSVEAEDWETAEKITSDLADDWSLFRNKAQYFVHVEKLYNIESLIYQSEKFIKGQELAHSLSQLKEISKQMDFIIYSEELSISNIF